MHTRVLLNDNLYLCMYLYMDVLKSVLHKSYSLFDYTIFSLKLCMRYTDNISLIDGTHTH